jgi:predicted Zn-dependent peptidase
MEELQHIITLANGIRIIHLEVKNSEIVHCGFMINAGSRDESPENNGVAHFIEHTVFKGTNRRKSHHILRRIESVGGELNAYTTREKTSYYASCLKQYAERAIDLLSDITFDSVFPEKELEKEKKVILEEIDMYDDSPEESIYDDFYTYIFKDHPLGYNILGTKTTVPTLTGKHIRDFIASHYTADKLVLSIVGDLTKKQAEALGNRFLAKISIPQHDDSIREKPAMNAQFSVTKEKDFAQTHVILGSRAFSRNDEKRYGLSLINNILGAAGMSARLNMEVREKNALVYNIGTHYSSYQDSGVFSIYYAADDKNVQRCQDIIFRELKKMRDIKFSDHQLKQSKIQLLGQMAQIVENNGVHMQHQARSILDYGAIYGFKDFMQEIDKVTATDIIEISKEIFDPKMISVLIYQQEKS